MTTVTLSTTKAAFRKAKNKLPKGAAAILIVLNPHNPEQLLYASNLNDNGVLIAIDSLQQTINSKSTTDGPEIS
jgi:hypothetical protein